MKIKFILTTMLTVVCYGNLHAQQPWTLQRCIEYAIEHNLNIKMQQQQVETQEVALSTSKNQFLPDLNGNAQQSFNFGRGLTADNTYANRNTQSFGMGLSTSIPIFTGGERINDLALKKLNLQAALADLSKAKENLSIQIASGYLEALYQQELAQIAQRQLELSKLQLSKKQALLANGKASEAEVAEIKASVAADESQVTQTHNNYQLALLNLSQMLELPSFDQMEVVAPASDEIEKLIIELPETIYQQAVTFKPQIQAEQLRLKGAEKSIQIARSGLMPRLSFGAGLSTNYYNTSGFQAAPFSTQLKDNFSKYMSIGLSVPIFNRFATRNQIRTAKIRYNTQLLQLEQSKKDLYKEIQQAYFNATAAQKQYESSMTAQEASMESFRLMTAKYENGKASLTEYQESKTKLTRAEADLAQAKYALLFRHKILLFYRGENM